MSTLLQVYQKLCAEDLFPSKEVTDPHKRQNRRNDLKTALRYLAECYDSTPDHVPLTPDIEADYKERLRDMLIAKGKGPSTIRNSIQGVGQFLRAFHRMQQTPPVPIAPPVLLPVRATRYAIAERSPYAHQAWLIQSTYLLYEEHWPDDIRVQFHRYLALKKNDLRASTITKRRHHLMQYLGYLSMTGDDRLGHLPPASREKLGLKAYRADMNEILAPPVFSSWGDLFVLSHVESFVTWHAWRAQTEVDAKVKEREPSKPTATGACVAETVNSIAFTLKRKERQRLFAYRRGLTRPRKLHDKKAEYHKFSFAELEAIAHTLIDQARRYRVHAGHETAYPGARASGRFQTGLIVMMGWRTPMRARNWCEALLDMNLKRVNGVYHWHFEGDELKIGTRKRDRNIFDIPIDAEVIPYLEEYLNVWRPKIRGADQERHIFLTERGDPLNHRALCARLRLHVYRNSGKRLYTHLLRTIFTSNHLRAGIDINSVAYGLNDTAQTVWGAYNELYAEEHQQSLQEANRRALNA